MEEKEILVNQTENAEQAAEETVAPKMYSQEELDTIVGKRLARKEAKIRKEYDRQYGDLVDTLKAGTGKESVEEMTDTFAEFYRKKGINIPQKPSYSEKDIEVLAQAEAADIISAGFEEVVEETDRLAQLGAANMTAREKAVFKALAEYRQNTERSHELSKIGVKEDVYNSKEFKDFASKFNANTPISDIYDIYHKTQPKKEIKTMGSMKQMPETGVKDYYSPEEIERLTMEELDDPKVWEAVRRSMTGG